MRVITGKYKGRTLVAPTTDTRPTLDRTKETLFNIINTYIVDSVVLDLFAGSGQLAIECLSRGASKAILCDNNLQAVKAIKTNFEKIGETPNLFVGNYVQCLGTIAKNSLDIVFVDPPYKSGYYNNVLQQISNLQLLSDSGIIICEHSNEDNLPNQVGDLVTYDSRKIGSVRFSFYKRG